MRRMGDSQLDNFRRELNSSLAYGALADMDLPVTSDDGGCPVVVALEDERVSVVLGRLRAVGGFANLFVRGGGRRLRVASVINSSCAIPIPDDDMTGDEGPGPTATVGTFLDYVERRPNGVMLSAALGHPAWARDAHTVEFAGSAL